MDRGADPAHPNQEEYWIMYFDNSLKLGRARIGVLLISQSGYKLWYAL